MAKRRKFHELSAENDIRYRGPISYQGFQILGWLCIVISVIAMEIKLGGHIDPSFASQTEGTLNALNYISTMSLPFLLIANFSRILNNSEGYKKQLLRNGGAAAGIALVTILFAGRYLIGTLGLFVADPENVMPVLTQSFRSVSPNGFLAFNLFIDLFLCTLFMFFLNAQPARVFTGKKRIIFRLFALLPIAYEVYSFVLKGQAASGNIALPLWSFPLLTVKPPVTFLVFVILALFIKTRELRFRRHGRTHEEYQAFLNTNRNSLHFSVFLSIIMVIAAMADFIIMFLLTLKAVPNVEVLQDSDQIMEYAATAVAMGFGESVPLVLVAPFVLLYSYTRQPKNKKLSMLIPPVAIVLILLLLLESVRQALVMYIVPTEKPFVREIIETFTSGAAAG